MPVLDEGPVRQSHLIPEPSQRLREVALCCDASLPCQLEQKHPRPVHLGPGSRRDSRKRKEKENWVIATISIMQDRDIVICLPVRILRDLSRMSNERQQAL